MKIELTTSAIIGTNQNPQPAGNVVEVDEAEGNALVASGYAKETRKAVTSQGETLDALNDANRLPAGTVDHEGNAVTTATDNAARNTEANAGGTKRAGQPTERK
ncbi:MAG TPA: hypothetical protein VGB05_09710 [Pyrinomonadaceae bacterium]|jgi:hypothetical protein